MLATTQYTCMQNIHSEWRNANISKASKQHATCKFINLKILNINYYIFQYFLTEQLSEVDLLLGCDVIKQNDSELGSIDLEICGVIKQNQSEDGHIQFSVSYWIVTSICKATFCRKPH